MPQKQLLQSAGDGTAVPQGYVGEVISLTGSVSVPSNTNNTLLVSSQTPPVGVYLMVGSVLFSHAGSVTVGNYPLATIIDTQGAGSTVATTTQIPSKPALSNAELSLAFSFIFNATGSNKPTFRLESFAGIGCTCSFMNSRLIRIA